MNFINMNIKDFIDYISIEEKLSLFNIILFNYNNFN